MAIVMNQAIVAIIKKDFRGITANRRLFSSILIVPLILTVVLPSVFLLSIYLVPESRDLQEFLKLLPPEAREADKKQAVSGLFLNNLMPLFFLVVPVMASSIMAGSSFVGEKEKHTLETLFYCPLSVKQIFRAKVLASFLLGMVVSFLSFSAMFLILETESFFVAGGPFLPAISWLVVILLLSPSVSLIAITLIVRGSAKAQSVEESQQAAVFLVIPLLLLIAGQFTGLLLLNGWILLALGVLCALLACLLLKRAMRGFSYEKLLR